MYGYYLGQYRWEVRSRVCECGRARGHVGFHDSDDIRCMVRSSVEPVLGRCDAAGIHCVLGVGVHSHPHSVVKLNHCHLSQETRRGSVRLFSPIKTIHCLHSLSYCSWFVNLATNTFRCWAVSHTSFRNSTGARLQYSTSNWRNSLVSRWRLALEFRVYTPQPATA